MFVIAGLGNPGKEYAGTRHNVGFGALDELADKYRISVDTGKHKALIGKGIIEGEKVILVKPLTYMNLSGDSLREVLDYYKLPPERLLVIYDDINLDVGQLRIREKGSAGGHNGMKSIIARVGSDAFPRIRVGVGAKPPRMSIKPRRNFRDSCRAASRRTATGAATAARAAIARCAIKIPPSRSRKFRRARSAAA